MQSVGRKRAFSARMSSEQLVNGLWPGTHNLREEEREDKCSELYHCVVVEVTRLN
jgi:hypothetical protein